MNIKTHKNQMENRLIHSQYNGKEKEARMCMAFDTVLRTLYTYLRRKGETGKKKILKRHPTDLHYIVICRR